MNEATVGTIKPFIISIKNVLQCGPGDSLGAVLTRTKISHDSIFVFKGSEFLGIVSVHDALYRSRYPLHTEVRKAVFKPPHLTTKSPIYMAAEAMITCKAYALPVFDKKEKLVGAVFADDILTGIAKKKLVLERLLQEIQIQKPITEQSDASTKKIYQKLRTDKISRIVLVDKVGDIAGIVTRRDIHDAFSSEVQRQRFSKRDHVQHNSFFDEEKVSRRSGPVSEFSSKLVLTASKKESIRLMLSKMLKNGKNSIVIVDGKKPIGFLSKHDFLKAVVSLKPDLSVPIIFEDKKNLLGDYTKISVYGLVRNLADKLEARVHPMYIEVHLSGRKNAVGKANQYEVTLHAKTKKGNLFIANAKNHDVIAVFHDAIQKLQRQIFRR